MIAGKKILFVHSSAGLYGADRCLYWLAAGLQELGASVEVVVPFSGMLVDKLRSVGIKVHILDPIVFRRSVMKPAGLVRMMLMLGPSVWRLKRLIKKNNIDLVHTNTGVIIGGALAARFSGVPHVWHFREMLTEFRHFWTIYEPMVRKTSQEIICISNAVASQFKSSKAFKKISVVYDGIPLPEEKNSACHDEKHKEIIKLVCVGVLAPYKGHDVLLEAVRILIDRGHKIELTVIGDIFGKQVKHREDLKMLASSLNLGKSVLFKGFKSDIGPHISKSDIFILPSKRPEGLGLVVLEAMAYGKPVVATKGGGVNEIINDRVNGMLVEPGDRLALANKIEELIKDPGLSKSLAVRGYTTVSESFSVQAMIENMEKIYLRVLSN